MIMTIQLTNFECNEKVRKFKNLVPLFVKFKGESRKKYRTLDKTFLLGGGSGGGESTHF